MVCGLAGDFRGASPSSSWPGDLCGAHALSVLTDIVGDRSIPLGPRQARGVHLSGARKGELSDVDREHVPGATQDSQKHLLAQFHALLLSARRTT